MRAFPIILAFFIALVVFAVFKILGFFLQLAMGAAVIGFLAGLAIAIWWSRRR